MRTRDPGPGPIFALTLLPLLLLAASPAAAEPRTYTLVPGRCSFVAQLFKDGIGSGFAHDHVVRARTLSGTVKLDPAAPRASELRIQVDARSLDPDPPALRKAYGYKEMLSASDRGKVAANMKGADQLNVKRFPKITFRSTRVAPMKKAGRYKVEGKLTLRGVTRKVSMIVKARLSGDTLKGTGQLRIKQSQYGYEPYSAGLGMVKVKDPVTINIYLEAKASST